MGDSKYTLIFLRDAAKQLTRLSKPIRLNISRHIDQLSSDPRPQQAKPLRGQLAVWRLRVGSYRVIYEVNDLERQVLVSKVGHRRDVYRGLD